MRRRSITGSTKRTGADHPPAEALSALLHEGLVAEEAEQIIAHLDACPQCATALDQMNPALALYRRYRDGAQAAALKPWTDIEAEMDRVDRELGRVVAFPRGRPTYARALTGAVAASLIFAALMLWPAGHGAEARAEVLLAAARKAAPAANPGKRLRVRTTTASFIRPSVLRGETAEGGAIRAKFESAHFDWEDPLNPAVYDAWRAHLKHRTVKVEEDREKAVIETSTTDGALVNASLTIGEADMSVEGARFIFADQDWVEITPLEETIGMAAAPAPPALPPAVKPKREEIPLPQRELRVWAAIDRLNAAAGAPISVEIESPEQIVVTTYGLTPERQDELRASLEAVPGVTLRSADSGTAATDSHPPDSVIDLSESIASRAHRIDELVRRFPPEVEAALPTADRDTLMELRSKDTARLIFDIAALSRQLAKQHSINTGPVRDVALSTGELLKSAMEVDRLVTSLYAGTPDAVASWSELSAALVRLRELANLYERSLEPRR